MRSLPALLLAWTVAVAPGVALAASFEDALREKIERFVRSRTTGNPAEVSVPALADFLSPGVDGSALHVELSTRKQGRLAGPIPVTVVLRDGAREVTRRIVTVRVREEESVWVAARDLERGETLGRRDLVRAQRDLRTLPRDATSKLEALVGKQLKRRVPEGRAMRRGWLEQAALIRRGQQVPLIFRLGTLLIEGMGRAASDGAEGERIRVTNVDSRREVWGRVGPEGAVYVGD